MWTVVLWVHSTLHATLMLTISKHQENIFHRNLYLLSGEEIILETTAIEVVQFQETLNKHTIWKQLIKES